MGSDGLAGMQLQQQLSEFLYAEMAHTVGAYKVACDKLESLLGELRRRKEEAGAPSETPPAREVLEKAAEAALQCNLHLRRELHRSTNLEEEDDGMSRRPSPYVSSQREEYFSERELLLDVSTFYGDAATALTMHLQEPERGAKLDAPPGFVLGARLAFAQDPQRRGDHAELIRGRIDRTVARHGDVNDLRGRKPEPPAAKPRPSKARNDRFRAILDGSAGGKQSLLLTILKAMTEAHMAMHEAEHIRAQTFGKMFSSIPDTQKEAQRLLRYGLELNTFVFAAARATPWIFSEDDAERDFVLVNYPKCCETLAPTYCMWISAQLSLLSLHRRAFTWWTMGKHDRAYRDFHKLMRLLRALRRPAERRGLRVPGTKTFIEGMTAMSEHHIGRIYRGQHAHRLALRYFRRGSDHLRGWEDDEEIGPLIKNSHWRLNRLINEGKANYELGRVKRSMLCYARAWRAFLLLVESETHATANLAVVEAFTKWLEPLVDDPELNRRELRVRLEPLVDQFVTLRTPPNLRLLAADIVMRMGHLLFILKLPPADWDPDNLAMRDERGEIKSPHDLAGKCIGKAAFLDPTSTLTAADRLKIEQATSKPVEITEDVPTVPLGRHWPSGSGRFEEAARITEYTLQRWLKAAPEGGDTSTEHVEVARELLASFLAHTDSSNVKLAQVYRYLMQDPKEDLRDSTTDDYALDLVCLRRYSSFFPFLPRPSAFRAPGGGYFVHALEKGRKAEPFGIAVDPGPDFIENLYRCGYGLADIHMIVLTHDHADHIASLDAMLALMGIRMGLGDETFKRKRKQRLAIVGNESICERYGFFNDENTDPAQVPLPRIDAVRVLSFEQLEEITTAPADERGRRVKEAEIFLKPTTLRIERVKSWGHLDANGFVSQAFMLSLGPDNARSSVLFTGDTGLPSNFPEDTGEPEEAHLLAPGKKTLAEAVRQADVVVAHMSSVPLRELRELANLEATPPDQAIDEFRKLWKQAAKKAARKPRTSNKDEKEGIRQTGFLLNQLQFGFRSRPANTPDGFGVSPFSPIDEIRGQPERHLYLTGMLKIAEAMAQEGRDRAPLLLIGELREELGTFRTRIANRISKAYFDPVEPQPSALTTDIGLRVRLSGTAGRETSPISVLCTTCDLDNDLIPAERFHRPREIHEVCVKGEDEGVFYNCGLHDPRSQNDYLWLESVERFDVFAD
jgi:hypothetical protein